MGVAAALAMVRRNRFDDNEYDHERQDARVARKSFF